MKKTTFILKSLLVFLFFICGNSSFSQTVETFNTAGASTWVCPTGVTSITVEAWGAGGGGQRANGNPSAGGGGSGGGYVRTTYVVTPGATYNFYVGAGGSGNSGQNGEGSWFNNNTTIFAVGGIGAGAAISSNNTWGTGATALSTGNIGGTLASRYGGNGGNAGNNFSGGSGSSAGNTNGNNASGMTGGTAPTNGYAGVNGINVNGSGNPGNIGTGGSGGRTGNNTDRNGGNGGTGQIRITYTPPPSYCIPTNTYSTSYYISGVTTTGGIANISNSPTGFSAYTNYTSQFVSQLPGSSFTLNATHPSSTYAYSVWVDWNNDLDFDDAGENVLSTTYLSSPASLGSITIPGGQAVGNYRMRIRNAYLSSPAPACGAFNYGEAEDYTIQVVAPPACSGTPSAGSVTTNPSSGNAGSSYIVSASGFTIATGLTFQWQYSTNGGSTWTNAGASSGTYSNYSATAPAIGTTVLWQLIVTCTNSGLSATSTTGSFTSVATQNVPSSGNNTVTCGTNLVLYDNGGVSSDYASSSSGYTVLEAGLGATINISGNYTTESLDYIRIYSGTGTSGTLLATYSGTGSINYTGTAGQTLTVQFTSDGSVVYSGFALSVTYSGVCYPACAGTPSAGTVTTNPGAGIPGSSYTVSSTGYTGATGLTFQWQFSTNGGSTWSNAGASSGTYSNYSATAPALGTTVLWQLIVTCTNSGLSATSTTGTFSSVTSQNIPASGSNTVSCGTNIVLYDNGGSGADYTNSSSGYTVLEAGLGATITISGNYTTESVDYIRIYNGTGTAGTLLATYSGTGTINYTGTAGQTLTIQFTSDSSVVYSGFALSVSYSGVCFPVCAGTPSGGTVSTSPNTGWPGSSYTVSSTGHTLALNLTYQWQYSTNGGGTWTNAGASSSSYSNYTATAPASGLVHWRLLVTCTNSGITSNSSVGIFTTMEVSDVVTGCPNVVSGGLGLNGADPSPINCTATSTCVNLEATYLDLGETTDYIVEPILYNPPFSFNGLANPVSVNVDDVWSPVVNLPFDFCFYGNTYNQCVIGSNGILTFNTSVAGGSSGYSFSNNIPISGDGRLLENSIFGVFHDINPGIGGEVGWELITLPTGCRALVASWYNVPMFDENSILYTGMMVLYENSNIIEVYIKEKNIDNFGAGTWNDGNAVVGIQNATGTLASVPPGRNGLDTNWATANEAWRFVPNGNSIASITWHEGSGTSGPIVGTTPTINVCPSSTTTYTAEITYTLCDGRTIKETDETTVTINGAKVWNGSVNTDWNVANNWTPTGIPTALDCVVIADTANDPIISGTNYNGLGLNLTIDNNAVLTVNSNNFLSITDWVNINASGDLALQNGASLIQTNNVTNQGTMHMTRTANIRKLDYVYWSSPVTNFSLNSVSPGTTGYKYKWIPTIPSNTNGFGNWNSANESMVNGKGYIVRGPDSFTSIAAPFNAIFTGTPNNGIITTPIVRGTWNGGNYSTGVSTTLGTNEDDNWNLIGNPYPSAIDAIDFLTLNTNIDGFINLWTHGTLPSNSISDPFYEDFVYNYTPGDYITYNSSGASAGPGTFSGAIGAGQGFFVLMDHTSVSNSETVTFNNSLRSSTTNNSQFYRTSNENGKIWLDIIDSNGTNVRNLLAYVHDATNNRDRMFDAITNEKLNFNLFSLIGNETMKIQGRSLPFDQNDKVPLGIKIPQNGTYSIGIGALEGFFTNTSQNIYLEDLDQNIIHNLRETPYTFTSVAGRFTNRFILRYTNETLGGDDLIVDESNLWVISSEHLSVKSTKNEISSIRIFDVLGRELAHYPKINSYEISLNKIQKNNAGLIIQVTLSNGSIINKKVIY